MVSSMTVVQSAPMNGSSKMTQRRAPARVDPHICSGRGSSLADHHTTRIKSSLYNFVTRPTNSLGRFYSDKRFLSIL
ncbi:hypothetical protein R1flu_023300 [Riccia fluitans]|uniref:Uncharacterized protein n=1 Tax=Riccia fluitans TaxID=41844 RepID=A0ABD1XVQ3_9MARC